MGGKIFKTIPIETYRGCPYKCTFCNSPMHNTQVSKEKIAHSFLRRKTIENVRKEILDLKNKYNPGFLYFVDDSFLARPRKEIFEFCDMYEEFKIPFWFNTRPENCKVDFLKRLMISVYSSSEPSTVQASFIYYSVYHFKVKASDIATRLNHQPWCDFRIKPTIEFMSSSGS